MKRLTSFLIFISIMVVIVGRGSILLANEGDPRIAILPFENITNFPGANYIFLDSLYQELDKKLFSVPQEDVEAFLASRRIRYTGGINRLNAKILGKTLGADAVLVGSTDLFVEGAQDIYAGLTLRLVSTVDGSPIWADSVSYAGEDFATILGLGRVTSLEELSSSVIKKLVEDLTDEDLINKLTGLPTDADPFELEEIVIEPAVGRQGERIDIRLKILSMSDEPMEVKGLWNGTKVRFRISENGEYMGSTVFSKEEGVHHLDIVITDREMNRFPFYSVAKITVDSTPPVVNLAVGNRIFSPKKKGHTTFTPAMASFDAISEWSIEILNKEGKKVRGDRGYDRLPRGLIWKGENDSRMWVEDGMYTYRFKVKDMAGNETVISDTIEVKSIPPQIDLDIDIVEDLLVFLFYSDSGENVKSWKLVLMDKEGKEVKVIKGDGDVPSSVDYPINGEKIDDLYFSFDATDAAGNTFKTSNSISSILFKKSPFTNIPFTKRMDVKGLMIEDF